MLTSQENKGPTLAINEEVSPNKLQGKKAES